MFFPRDEGGPELAPRRVLGLRLSLNTPVVATQELAAGPARAAILVHEERDGRPNVTVGLRSLRSGERVLYGFEGDLREHSSLAVGIDAALSFGESMGFLFDDDELEASEPRGRDATARALGLWEELMGGAGSSAAAGPRQEAAESGAPGLARTAAEDAAEELLLDEEVAPDAEPAPAAVEGPGPAPRPLSKFRGGAAAARAGGGETARGRAGRPSRSAAALGRLKLVKRRRSGGGEEGSGSRSGWMLRLLGSF